MTLDDIKAIADVLGDVSTLTSDERYALDLYYKGLPTHFYDSKGNLHMRTRPPDKVIVPPPTFEETGS